MKSVALLLKLCTFICVNLSWQKGRGLETFLCCENEQDSTNDLTEEKVIVVIPLLDMRKMIINALSRKSFSENWSCLETTENLFFGPFIIVVFKPWESFTAWKFY